MLCWALVAAGFLLVAVAGVGFVVGRAASELSFSYVSGSPTVVLAFVSLLALGGAALLLHYQRGELLRHRGERDKAEQQARDGDGRQAEVQRHLRESNHQLRWLSEAMKQYAIITLDLEGRIVSWDNAAQSIYGYSAAEVLGQPYSRLCLQEDAASGKADQDIKRALVTGGYEDRSWHVRQGGWKFWAEIVFTPMREDPLTPTPLSAGERCRSEGSIGRVRGLLCLTRNISEHRQAEDALRSTRTLYRNLTETARDIVITFSKDGTITSLNLAFQKTTGLTRGDWIGQSVLSLAHPDDLERMRDLLQRIAGGETTPVAELRIRLASGEYLAAEWMTTPQLQDGEVRGGLALVRDLTDRKKAEESLRATEEKLRQAQKMEAIGRLAGGIAHDFNNLLTVILGNAEMFLMSCQDAQLQLYATEITKAGDRAATLTRQLLAFSRKTVMQPRVIDVNTRVGNLHNMLQRLIGEDVDLVIRLHEGPLHVKADPSQIEQVIMNLVVNARDAMPDGGALTIETSAAVLEPGSNGQKTLAISAAIPLRAGARRYAALKVTDTGVGMDDHVKRHLFEPFFTTKEQGKGTGLGLAMVYGIVQQSDGHIEVDSTPGQGATFKIYLPLTSESTLPAEQTDNQGSWHLGGTETILLVEDEDGVRSLASSALRLNGYKVLECADGAKALTLCESFQGPIDLVITDVIMPCLGGVDLARHVSQLHPRAKVLFMSGYPDRDFDFGSGAPVCYIQKPFAAQELTARVRQLLDTPADVPIGV
jgi:PAS domain S-box-containing protein